MPAQVQRGNTFVSQGTDYLKRHKKILLCYCHVEAELLARYVQHLPIFTGPATAEQTFRFAWLVDLFQVCSNGKGQGADTQNSLDQCFCSSKAGGAELAQLQEVNVC